MSSVPCSRLALGAWLAALLAGGAPACASSTNELPSPPATPPAASPADTRSASPPAARRSAAASASSVPTAVTEQPQHCGQDPSSELPLYRGDVGEGNRVVRIINNSQEDVQARLLDERLAPVHAGTLRVLAGQKGEYHVPAGVYVLRYRRAGNCQVMRGTPLRLVGHNAGVEIAIHPRFAKGGHSNMRPVKEPL